MQINLSFLKIDLHYNLVKLKEREADGQFVGQEIVLSQQENLYYWSRRAKSSSAEVDYVAVIDGRIHPVEVKSGSSGRLKSLHLFLQAYQNSPGGIVFSTRPYEELPTQRVKFIPIYFALSATGWYQGGK